MTTSRTSRFTPTPDCVLCGRKMVWAFAEEAWQKDGFVCDCEDEPTEYTECLSCGSSGPVGGECDDCHCEMGT